ncbi:CcdC protein domain-containing protein [Camelliibacillus cellulosilyticus]
MLQPTTVFIFLLILFGIYRRIRRTIGWQPFDQRRMVIRTILLLVIGLIFFGLGAAHPISLISDIIGVLLGVILAYYSSTITQFENRDDRWYYQPNKWIGTVVSFIFIGRLAYRLIAIKSIGTAYAAQGTANGFQNANMVMGNSWTAGLLLIMFSYYVVYTMILLTKKKTLLDE